MSGGLVYLLSEFLRHLPTCEVQTKLTPRPREMAAPANRKTPQPVEGSEFPPLDIVALGKQRRA